MMTQRKQTPKQAAYLFFLRNAGFGYDPQKESRQAGRSRCARELAKAERDARALGYTFTWEVDEDADNSWMSLESQAENQEAFGCVCVDPDGNHAASLWGIFEPSREYRRVVEAELALEALQGMETK